jgi:ribonucleotide monophosphatase NagD (HAD superfamily)
VETDITFGNRQGATTLLVFSGATSEKHLDKLKQGVEQKNTDPDLLPNFCVSNVGQFFQFIKA